MKKITFIIFSLLIVGCSSTTNVKRKVSIEISQENQSARIIVIDKISKSDNSMKELARLSLPGIIASLGCKGNNIDASWENSGNSVTSTENPDAKTITLLVQCANGI